MSRLSEALRAHLVEPRNVGEPAGGVDLRGEARNAACRDHVVLYLQVREGRVAAAGFRASGCPAALGIGSAATELLADEIVDAGLSSRVRERFVAAHGEPAALHRHALALVTEALETLSPPGD